MSGRVSVFDSVYVSWHACLSDVIVAAICKVWLFDDETTLHAWSPRTKQLVSREDYGCTYPLWLLLQSVKRDNVMMGLRCIHHTMITWATRPAALGLKLSPPWMWLLPLSVKYMKMSWPCNFHAQVETRVFIYAVQRFTSWSWPPNPNSNSNSNCIRVLVRLRCWSI